MNTTAQPNAILAKKFSLREGWCMAFPSDNEVQILQSIYAAPAFTLKDPQCAGWVKKAFEKLNGKWTVQAILQVTPDSRQEQLLTLLTQLQRRYLYDVSLQEQSVFPPWLSQRLAYQKTALDAYTDVVAEKTVAISGSGKLASQVATMAGQLGFAGVYWLNGAQHQNVPGNIEQVHLHDNSALEQALNSLRPDLIICADDVFSVRRLQTIERYSQRHATRWVVTRVDGWHIQVGPCFIPGQSGCLSCWLNSAAMEPVTTLLNAIPESELARLQQQAENPAFSAIAAGMLISDLPTLMGIPSQNLNGSASLTLARYTRLDMAEFSVSTTHVHKHTCCSQCAGIAA